MQIAIITGGTSSEREIALRSSRMFQRHLPDADYYVFPEEMPQFLARYSKYDLAIPVFHGIYGEDGQVFAFLETLGIATAFSPWQTHALTIDKYATDSVLRTRGYPLPEEFLVRKNESAPTSHLGFPLVVKPNRGGSTIGTSLVRNEEELHRAIGLVHAEQHDDAIVQSCLPGREFTVSIIGNGTPEVLGIAEICNEDAIFNYEEKYSGPAEFENYGTEIANGLREELERHSLSIYQFVGCRGIARADFRCDTSGKPFFLEINTIPGMTDVSLLPKAALSRGISEKELVERIVGLSLENR